MAHAGNDDSHGGHGHDSHGADTHGADSHGGHGSHGDDSHGGGHGHGDSHGQEGHGGHGGHGAAHAAKPGVAAYAPSEEEKKRWWAMPFDSTTNFSLLGLFLGWIMDRNNRKVDLQLK